MPIARCRPALAVTAALAALAASLVLAEAVASGWSREYGLDIWNLPEQARVIERENARSDRLELNADRLREQITASNEVVAELIAGRARLAGAAKELEVINREREGIATVLEHNYPTASTYHLRFARWAVDEARWRLAGDATRQAAIVNRLESEYAEMRGADGRQRPGEYDRSGH